MTKCSIVGTLILLGMSYSLQAQTPTPTQIEFDNPGSPCARGVATPCTSADNRAKFFAIPPDPAAVDPAHPDILPRFKAFWITGDGNYWDFPDTDTDAESLTPATPYNYARSGTYTVSTYLTGKYTDHNPPQGAARPINVGNPPPPPPTGSNPNAPTDFRRRPGSGDYDFFPIHDLRKDYLTPFILTYPATIDSTWGYLFFNGHGSGDNTGSAWTEQPLVYKKTDGEVANYYNGVVANIKSYPSASLTKTGELGIDGTAFVPEFSAINSRYNNVLYFPLERVPAASLPTGFTHKRYFPVFWADKKVPIGEKDSLLAFCYIVTGTKPAPPDRRSAISAMLETIGLHMTAESPVNFTDGFSDGVSEERLSAVGKLQQQIKAPLQYIQGIYSGNVEYVAAHDPNQLTVKKVEPLADGNYRITFHLEMCNSGGGRTTHQTINLFDRFGRFHDFNFMASPVAETPAASRHYILESDLEIEGIPDTGYAMMCKSLEFTAVTNCDGIRSLWASNPERAFEVCVKFKEAFDTECGENMGIDSCKFKVDNNCLCVDSVKAPTCGGDNWLLVFLLIFVFILLIWKYFSDKANNM